MINKDIYAVLLAGGKGTRLWPLSMEGYSKPFIRFGKRKLLLEDVIERTQGIVYRKNIVIVIDKAKAKLLRRFTKGIPKKNILIEPFGRNTASAIGLAAINLKPESLMVVFPADQFIENLGNFKKTIKEGLNFIKDRKEALLCLGTVPTGISESFGYIKVSKSVTGNIFCAGKFVEKPSLAKAGKFLRNPDYLWNAGIFIFRAGAILEAIKKCAPLLYKNLQRIKKDKRNILRAYSQMKNISIDYQIMEKTKNLYCLKGKFRWQDIGNWVSLDKLFKKDREGNICVGKVSLVGVSNSIVYNSGKHTIGAIGLKDMVIVHTDNGTLVCAKRDAEKVKQLIR